MQSRSISELLSYFTPESSSLNLFSISKENIIRDFESCFDSFTLETSSIKKNKPIILDLACGDIPYYFKMADFFPEGYIYIGIDIKPANDTLQIAKKIKLNNANFHLLVQDLYNKKTVYEEIKKISKQNKIDLILLENPAVGNADTKKTDDFLKYLLKEFIPFILEENNSLLHIQAASSKQISVIRSLLEEFNYNASENDGNFTSISTTPSQGNRLKSG